MRERSEAIAKIALQVGLGTCDVPWCAVGVRVELLSASFFGKRGTLASVSPTTVACSVKLDTSGNTVQSMISEIRPLRPSADSTGQTWVRLLSGENKGLRGKVETVDEDSGDLVVVLEKRDAPGQLGSDVEVLPLNLVVICATP
jgi:hypothetical protein